MISAAFPHHSSSRIVLQEGWPDELWLVANSLFLTNECTVSSYKTIEEGKVWDHRTPSQRQRLLSSTRWLLLEGRGIVKAIGASCVIFRFFWLTSVTSQIIVRGNWQESVSMVCDCCSNFFYSVTWKDFARGVTTKENTLTSIATTFRMLKRLLHVSCNVLIRQSATHFYWRLHYSRNGFCETWKWNFQWFLLRDWEHGFPDFSLGTEDWVFTTWAVTIASAIFIGALQNFDQTFAI